MMKWYVRKGLFKSTLHGTTPGMGLAIYHKEGKYTVVDDSRKTVVQIEGVSELELNIKDAEGRETEAQMILNPKEPLIRPAMADYMNFQMGGVSYQLVQHENRDIDIKAAGQKIGQITEILSGKPQIGLPDTMGAVQAAMFYVLGWIMLKEDDVDIV